MGLLEENRLSDFEISDLTNKHLNLRYSEGNSGMQLRDAQMNYPNFLTLVFDAEPTYGGRTKVGPSGQERYTQDDYEVRIRFNNIGKWISPNFSNLPFSQQKVQLEELFENNDEVQTSCDCPAEYWQGHLEKGSKIPRPNARILPFAGVQGKDIWSSIHGNRNGLTVCKHVYQAIAEIFEYIPDILKLLSKGSVSAGSVTAQPIDDAEPAQQSAGQPKDNKQLKTDKVEIVPEEPDMEEVSEPISDEKLTKEEKIGHAPTGDITDVKARKVKAKNTAGKGESEIEPAIEEPELTPESEKHTEEIADGEDEGLEETQPLKESVDPDNLSIDELFFETARCMGEIPDLLHKAYSRKLNDNFEGLKESTSFGNLFLRNLEYIQEEFSELNSTLKKRVYNLYIKETRINTRQLEFIVKIIDELKAPDVLKILSMVFSNTSCDQEDREKTHKAVTAYSEMYALYEHNLEIAKKKQPDLDHIKMAGFSVPENLKESQEFEQEDDSTIHHLSELFTRLVEAIDEIAPAHIRSEDEKTIQESLEGDRKYIKVLFICKEIRSYIDELKYKIKYNIKFTKQSVNELAWDISTLHNYKVLHILKRVFKLPHFDESDRERVHKACQMYDYLVQLYQHEINQYNIKHPTNRLDSPERPSIFTIEKYTLGEEDIKNSIEKLSERKKIKEGILSDWSEKKQLDKDYGKDRVQDKNGNWWRKETADKFGKENLHLLKINPATEQWEIIDEESNFKKSYPEFKEKIQKISAIYESKGFKTYYDDSDMMSNLNSNRSVLYQVYLDDRNFDYKSTDKTGLKARIFKNHLRNSWDKVSIVIDDLVVATKDRGKNLGNFLAYTLIENLKDCIIDIRLDDQSHGFWSHFRKKYPNISFYNTSTDGDKLIESIQSNAGNIRLSFQNINPNDILYKHNKSDFPMVYEYLIDRDYIKYEHISWFEIVEPQNGIIVGIVALWPKRILPNSVHISVFEIHKDYRKMGFGRDSILELTEQYKNTNIKVLTLQAREPELINYYSRFGFSESKFGEVKYMRKYLVN